MQIAPSTYYKWRVCPVRPTELEEAYLVNAIVDLFRKNKRVYGVRKLWRAARRAGLDVGRDQVGRLMRIAGVQGVRRGSHRVATTTRGHRDTLIWSDAAGARRRGRMRSGSRISRMCGPRPVSVMCRS